MLLRGVQPAVAECMEIAVDIEPKDLRAAAGGRVHSNLLVVVESREIVELAVDGRPGLQGELLDHRNAAEDWSLGNCFCVAAMNSLGALRIAEEALFSLPCCRARINHPSPRTASFSHRPDPWEFANSSDLATSVFSTCRSEGVGPRRLFAH
jgi:hypothetical protein